MLDEYDSARRGLSNYERGLFFELGRAHIEGKQPKRAGSGSFKCELAIRFASSIRRAPTVVERAVWNANLVVSMSGPRWSNCVVNEAVSNPDS